MVYAIGPVSGCHINPAVTVGILITKKMDAKYAPGYIAAQILGAILASALLLLIAKGAPGGYDPSAAGFAANGCPTPDNGMHPTRQVIQGPANKDLEKKSLRTEAG